MSSDPGSTPPLAGVRVVEFGGIGPGPHCCMLLSDLGAEVLRIDREGGNGWPNPIMDRGRAALTLDIRSDGGREKALRIVDRCDVLIEGMRPGVMERLGLGPAVALERNPRIVYGRMTGWGQEGPLAPRAGHDINYIGLTGALDGIGSPGSPPPPPLNLLGDFGGGSLYLAFGVVAALYERERSGRGQVVDAAIVDGVTSMMTMFSGLVPSGRISMDRSRNVLGGAAPFYRCYGCSDGRFVAVGCLEPKFYAELLSTLDLPAELARRQHDEGHWPEMIALLEATFAGRSRDKWAELFRDTDACVTPVLELGEAAAHPHAAARSSHILAHGLVQAAPAPRFSRTPGEIAPAWSALDMLRKWEVDTDLP